MLSLQRFGIVSGKGWVICDGQSCNPVRHRRKLGQVSWRIGRTNPALERSSAWFDRNDACDEVGLSVCDLPS
jgi:hypothetical protein